MSESNKSTGPRTPEGKAISSQNALKHGLSARDVVLKDDQEREDFAALQTGLAADLNPDGTLETLIFNRLLRASWDLRRVERMEVEQAADGIDLLDDICLRLERLARYKMRAERSFYRAHREITALQAERRAQAKAEEDERVRFDKETIGLVWVDEKGERTPLREHYEKHPEDRRRSPDTDSPASDA